jgi:hypothetical protein
MEYINHGKTEGATVALGGERISSWAIFMSGVTSVKTVGWMK